VVSAEPAPGGRRGRGMSCCSWLLGSLEKAGWAWVMEHQRAVMKMYEESQSADGSDFDSRY
jgi:hypothetical protein